MPDERDVWWRVARATIGVAFDAAFRCRYIGLHQVPTKGGALLAYNHVSVLDPFPVALGAFRRGRLTHFLAVADVFELPVRGWVMRRLQAVPVHRGKGDVEALDLAVKMLRSGGLVGIAPEGTVGDGLELRRGHTGAARMSLRAHVPVIPVGVWGAQRRWPRGGFRVSRPTRPTVVAAFGPPVEPRGDAGSRADVRAMTDQVMEGLARQVDEARAFA